MRLPLVPHPTTPSDAVRSIEVEVARSGNVLTLRYILSGDIEKIVFPAPAAPARTDGLWQSTCFEAFVMPSAGYIELNFSPSTEWAVYRFDGYRDGMMPAPIEPSLAPELAEDRFELAATAELAKPGSWRLGLSAVIEEQGSGKSYWARAHPPGEPDFHHPACFAIELPAAEKP